jgi:hypothetical protein
MSQLPTPPAGDHPTIEVLRVWIAKQELQCSLQVDVLPDPADWGLLLADVARHIARAVEEVDGKSAEETLAQIRGGFEKELDKPAEDAS